VRYLFMAYHYPKPEYRDDLLRWTQRVAAALRAQPGLLQVGDFDDPANGRIVAISIWESAAHFRAGWGPAMASLGAEAPYDQWEIRPLEIVALAEIEEPAAAGDPGN
jgi:quinol monooxygenase YgiN